MNAITGEEPRQDGFEHACVGHEPALEILGNQADVPSQIPDIPTLPPEDAHPGVVGSYRVEFPADQLEQGRFSGSIGADNGNPFVLTDKQREMPEDAG